MTLASIPPRASMAALLALAAICDGKSATTTTVERAELKPIRGRGAAAGRNEPCPCGSGKKFKRCCRGKE